MTIYLNEIAPWERKNEYYQTVQLGKSVNLQTDLIRQGFNLMIEAQLSSVSAIVASQELTQDILVGGFNEIITGINNISQGIEGLKSAFEFGISEVVWLLEKNRESFEKSLNLLATPLATQANELKLRGDNAYSMGLFDDALEEYSESEKINKYDFSTHISMGMIYLFNKIEKKKAMESFDKAIKYSRSKSNYHTSFSLLHKALIHRSFEELDKAENCASEAVNLSPDFAEAIYQYAGYRALNGKSINILSDAFELDPKYVLRAYSDEFFYNNISQLNSIVINLRDKKKEELKIIEETIFHRISNVLVDLNSFYPLFKDNIIELKNIEINIMELYKRNSYLDYRYCEFNKYLIDFDTIADKIKDKVISKHLETEKKINENIDTKKRPSSSRKFIFFGSKLNKENVEESELKSKAAKLKSLFNSPYLESIVKKNQDQNKMYVPKDNDHYVTCNKCGGIHLSQYPHKCKL